MIGTATGLIADIEEPARWRNGTASTGTIADAIVLITIHRETAAQPKSVFGAPGGSHVQHLALVLRMCVAEMTPGGVRMQTVAVLASRSCF